MTDPTPTDRIERFVRSFTDQIAVAFAAVEVPDPRPAKPTLGERLRELEWENAALTESRDSLADELAQQKRVTVAANDAIRRANERIGNMTEHIAELDEAVRKHQRELHDAVRAIPQSVQDANPEADSVAELITATVEQLRGELRAATDRADTHYSERERAARDLDQIRATVPGELLTPPGGASTAQLVEALVADWKRRGNHFDQLRDELIRTREELAQLRITHHDWVNGNHEKPVGLSETIQRINDVVTMQIEALSPTSGTGKTVDIRRRMLAKYPIAHDVEHLADEYLIKRAMNSIEREEGEGLLEAAALLIAHYDALQAAK
jgi:uncharacterized protein YoxC